MATISASTAGSTVTVTGTGYSANAKLTTISSFVSTDGKRRTLAMYTGTTDGSGALSAAVPVRYTSGTITVKVVDAAGAVLTTSSGQAV